MTDNMKIWDQLKETPPKYTKNFKRSGGFEGTAINPTFATQRMTGIFGPALQNSFSRPRRRRSHAISPARNSWPC